MKAVFLDIEATGLDPLRHHAIDLALEVLDLSLKESLGAYQTLVIPPEGGWESRDPVSMEINGYTWETVSAGKAALQVKQELLPLFQKWGIVRGEAVFICQNPSFDRGFFNQIVDVYTQEKLRWPYHWLDFASMYWALMAKKAQQEHLPFPTKLNLSKNEIARLYQLPPEANPHRAINGVDHLIACYKAVVGLE